MEKEIMSSPSLPRPFVTVVSKTSVYPDRPSKLGRLNLSAFDLNTLLYNYSQKGLLFPRPNNIILPFTDFLNLLRSSLSRALSFYPPLAGRLSTDPDGSFFVACNDAGIDFVHAVAPELPLADVAIHGSNQTDVAKDLFLFNGVVNLEGRTSPLAAVQVTELADGAFVGCSINHAVADCTSFWNFIHSWSEICRGVEMISQPPDLHRGVLDVNPPLVPCINIPAAGGPKMACSTAAPIRECTFRFSKKAIQEIKSRANSSTGAINEGREISSFQSLCAQLWRSVTRARKLNPGTETSLRMMASCRHRLEPPLGAHYFGNASLPIVTAAKAEEVAGRELGWCARLLHCNVAAFGDKAVRKALEKWKEERRPATSMGNPDGTSLIIASSTRFAVYDNDMGWGPPVAVVSEVANNFDGIVMAFSGREGEGSVDLQVCLVPETMDLLVADSELMQYVAN